MDTACQLAIFSITNNAPQLRQACVDYLLYCVRNGQAVSDYDILTDEIKNEVLQRGFKMAVTIKDK